jgi:hypothetical protein
MHVFGRALLLLITTGLFVRVWSDNARPYSEQPQRRPQSVAEGFHRAEHIVRRAPIYAQRVPAGHELALAKATTGTPTEPVIWRAATAPIPLPAGIAPGAYRVASDAGQVALLTIDTRPNAPQALSDARQNAQPAASSEFYVVTYGQSRWYFIRLATTFAADADAPAAEVPAAEVPATTGGAAIDYRKSPAAALPERWQFIGRPVDASEMISSVLTMSADGGPIENARPDPPALPEPL